MTLSKLIAKPVVQTAGLLVLAVVAFVLVPALVAGAGVGALFYWQGWGFGNGFAVGAAIATLKFVSDAVGITWPVEAHNENI